MYVLDQYNTIAHHELNQPRITHVMISSIYHYVDLSHN
uniref:Uncharacterized protein n=1 Tax=viral metagenome TaxID=1070528 RepID=A0A6C0BKA8_9ZZZZ